MTASADVRPARIITVNFKNLAIKIGMPCNHAYVSQMRALNKAVVARLVSICMRVALSA